MLTKECLKRKSKNKQKKMRKKKETHRKVYKRKRKSLKISQPELNIMSSKLQRIKLKT